jgi:histidine ammonia-lyase
MYLMDTLSEPIYGINTGFGSLCNVKISNENLSKLQENLVKSHACGRGRSAKGNRQTDALA